MNSNQYKNLLEKLDAGQKAVMVTVLKDKTCNSEKNQNKFVFIEEDLKASTFSHTFDEKEYQTIYQKSQEALETGNLQFIETSEEAYLIEPYFPEPNLIIFGGGHIAKPLAEFGARAGFSVTVIDDRPSFANQERFPTAKKVICESFEKCFDFLQLNQATFAVIVTRGHRHDMDCLRKVLQHKTAYVGMIGSKRRVKGVMEQMLNEGYNKEKIDEVNAPIGLDIGAVTPDEIAFSIIGELISYRRFVNAKKGLAKTSKLNWPEFDREILIELGKSDDAPKAIVTIMATKGSVPRKKGAKMMVWPFGKILGSIGGGCSEGEVINHAREMIQSKGYGVESIDMTGYVAEDEGMVCGGIMEVVIETI